MATRQTDRAIPASPVAGTDPCPRDLCVLSSHQHADCLQQLHDAPQQRGHAKMSARLCTLYHILAGKVKRISSPDDRHTDRESTCQFAAFVLTLGVITSDARKVWAKAGAWRAPMSDRVPITEYPTRTPIRDESGNQPWCSVDALPRSLRASVIKYQGGHLCPRNFRGSRGSFPRSSPPL